MNCMKRLVIVVLLVLVACQQQAVQQKDALAVSQFRVGSEGVRAEFLTNLPPARIFDTEPLSVTLRLENRGTGVVGGPGDRVFLSGFDPSIITGISAVGEQISDIRPRDQFTPQGGVDHVTFQGRVRSLRSKGVDRYPARLQATLCYGYETVASANVCVDPNPFAPTIQQKVCTPGFVGLGGGQGAPVAVTGVEVDPALGKTRFRIQVQNVGGGELFRPESLERCSPFSEGLSFDNVDVLKVKSVLVSDRQLLQKCAPLSNGELRLVNGVGTLFCELDRVAGVAAFVAPLVVQLEYGYRTTLLRNVDILPSS